MSILQLTFIVLHNEPSPIAIISVIISMVSVCSKLFLVISQVNQSKSWGPKILMWFCFVVDFVGIFFIISFSFYVPSNPLVAAHFEMLQTFMFWESIICVAPCAFGVALLFVYIFEDAVDSK